MTGNNSNKRLAKDGRSRFFHELNREGTACSEDCPACLDLQIITPPTYEPCKHADLDAEGTCRDCRVYNIYDDPNSIEYYLLKRWQSRRSA